MICLTIFMLGDLLCGFSRSAIQLYVFRAIAGIGGGGINSLCMIIVSDIVSLKDRGKVPPDIMQIVVSRIYGCRCCPWIRSCKKEFLVSRLTWKGSPGWWLLCSKVDMALGLLVWSRPSISNCQVHHPFDAYLHRSYIVCSSEASARRREETTRSSRLSRFNLSDIVGASNTGSIRSKRR